MKEAVPSNPNTCPHTTTETVRYRISRDASDGCEWCVRCGAFKAEIGGEWHTPINYAPETAALPDDFIGSVRALCVAGRTTGGVAGRDEGLCRVLDRVEAMLEAIDDPDWQRGARGLPPTTGAK